jgi:hypothetical protein
MTTFFYLTENLGGLVMLGAGLATNFLIYYFFWGSGSTFLMFLFEDFS